MGSEGEFLNQILYLLQQKILVKFSLEDMRDMANFTIKKGKKHANEGPTNNTKTISCKRQYLSLRLGAESAFCPMCTLQISCMTTMTTNDCHTAILPSVNSYKLF